MSAPLPSLDRADSTVSVLELSTQYPSDLLGLPRAGLRLSWRSSVPQVGYQLRADAEVAEPVAGTASIGVPAPGGDLPEGATRSLAVRIATADGWSEWSEPLVVEGAVDASRLPASAVTADVPTAGASPLLRTAFELGAEVVRARLVSTSLGVHELRLNGVKVGNEHLAPGWTAYQERIVYATHDVTGLLRDGENVLGGMLADGWYRGRLGWKDGYEHYGTRLGLVVLLEAELADGSVVRVSSGDGWRTATGGILASSIYDGSDHDLAAEPGGWDQPGFDDSAWAEAEVLPVDLSLFEPRSTTGVRTIAELPMTIEQRPDRVFLDGGQNVAGWVRLVVRGRPGDLVTVRHAEVLEPDGSLHVKALRTARATDTYLLDAEGLTTLEPAFTFHGFQYADVTGAEVVEATAVAISSAVTPRGSFEADESALNRLHSNVVWSQLDNFVSVPTDCPQRDERLGWTGDAQAFAATANTLFDVESFWLSWLRDLEIDQTDEGGVPAVVPNILEDDFETQDRPESVMGRAGWADAATIVPWAIYESFGSDEALVRQLDSMRRWVDHLERRAGESGLLPTEFQFGDWLDPDAPGDEPWRAKVSADYVANAFFARSARLLADAERLVGDARNAERYAALADRVARDTWARWGEEAIGSQTGSALALQFRIAPDSERERIGAGLADQVREENGRIATGFLGTPLVLHALAETGHVDEAYLMLLRREAPSWLYQVEMGATTVWERWDALQPDGSIHSGDMANGDGMLSFNHYAYGAVVDWMYRYVAGIAPTIDDPGYRTVVVQPRPVAGMAFARASVESRLGRVSIDWRCEEGGPFELSLEVPPGATAVLDLPVTETSDVLLGGAPLTEDRLGAGVHRIVVTDPAVASVPSRTTA